MKFSVAMCVYYKDNANFFQLAIESIINQTIIPDEVVIVVDGPIPESIQNVIRNYQEKYVFLKIVYHQENRGYAKARQTALENCTYELIALMDSDDITLPDRFEKQLKIFQNNPEISVVGGYISEFIDDPNNVFGIRKTPLTNEECIMYAHTRSPVNNVTAMYKKSDVLSVGGYKTDIFPEDYYLWVRMLIQGYRFLNISEILCHVRLDSNMFKRRGGLKLYKNNKKLQKYMLNNQFISFRQYMINNAIRFIVQVLMPNSLREVFYKKIARR